MFPFLKKKKEAMMNGDEAAEVRKHDDGSEYDPMEAVAEDLIHAIHSKSIQGVKEALRSAFDLADSEPHYEGEHLDE